MLLSDDILGSIFMWNAIDNSVQVEDRLTTTRISSHICAHWRRLILESTSIWAKLIWIDHEKKKEWTQEVLTRAGSSSCLWVYVRWIVEHGILPTPIPPILDVIFTQHWNRVEVFRASIYYKDALFWKNLERPAPNLRVFYIIICDSLGNPAHPRGLEKMLPSNLFSNHAPLLTSLSCPYFYIDNGLPWLSQIDTLAMSAASLARLLDIIESTPRLRILRVFGVRNADKASDAECARLASMSPLIIPRLATFAMFDMGSMDIQVFNALWSTKSKSPAESRTFQHINWGGTPDGIEDRDFHLAFENILYHHNFPTSDSKDMDWTLSISDQSIPTLAFNISSFSSTFTFGLCFFDMPSNRWNSILGHLKPYAGYIRRLSLYISNSNAALVDLHPLMLNLRSISVTMTDLQWCNRLQDSKGPLFPVLEMIKFIEGLGLKKNGNLDSLVGFLERRQNVGWALPTVHIDEDADMSHVCGTLNRFAGLRITWNVLERQMEYVCGELC